jgi:predicted nuclease of predicted toxin-antitoxin system
MRFLVDAQLPPALARWLAANGHEATHVSDVGLQTASDPAIWDHALAVSSVIVTKDEDFAQRKVLAQ